MTIEPKAIEILKAACYRLAAARSMSFTAVVTYENPSRLGTPLAYTTKSEVTLLRPHKLRVITPQMALQRNSITKDVFVQVWVGSEDKLPRMVRAVYRADRARLRHQLEISDWKIDLMAVLLPGHAFAWSHANRWGGSTSHEEGSGSTTRTDACGGSETHTYGRGTTATSQYGGTATHAYGSGYTTYTTSYGATACRSPYYHPAYPYPAYHPPTTVNVHGSNCNNCGGWSTAGAAVGMITGAAVASAGSAAASSNAYSSGYAAGSANTAASTNAYNAGVAAGSANTASAYNAGVAAGSAASSSAAPAVSPPPAGDNFAMGAVYATLPAGCITPNVQGKTYYLCGNTWFKPQYGANGVFYEVVPTP